MATAPTRKKPGPAPHPKGKAIPTAPAKNPSHSTRVKQKADTQDARFAKLKAMAVSATTARTQAIKSPNRHLTEMQMMFVRHWAAGESILTASSRAGYSDNGTYAYRLSKDPLIVEIYQREKKLYEEACQMTRKKVMDGFLDAAEMARLQADPTAMVGAWREVGKMCGYYEPKKVDVNVSINGQITQKVERLSDDMLLKLIKGEAGADVLDVEMREVPELENE